MRRAVPFVGSASDTLANATVVDHVATLPRFRRLRHVLIRLIENRGPVLAGATMESRDQTVDSIILSPREAIRQSTVLRANPDFWMAQGDWPIPDNQNLILFLRNDSGQTVSWQASWLIE